VSQKKVELSVKSGAFLISLSFAEKPMEAAVAEYLERKEEAPPAAPRTNCAH
jgi:hypothetical protein